jgi:hypothetical protein
MPSAIAEGSKQTGLLGNHVALNLVSLAWIGRPAYDPIDNSNFSTQFKGKVTMSACRATRAVPYSVWIPSPSGSKIAF